MGKERRAQQREFDFNAEQAQLNRDFQSSEAETARAWQTSERVAEQEFQSPVNQAKLVRQAGLNPAVYFGQNGTFSTSSPSAPSASVPSGSMAQGSSSAVSNIPQLISSAGEMVKALSGLNKDTAQAKEIRTLLEGRLEGLVLDNQQKNIVNETYIIERDISKLTKDVKVKQAYQDYVVSCADYYLKLSQGDKNVSDSQLNYSQLNLNSLLADIKGSEGAMLRFRVANQQKEFDTLINLQRSQANKNYAEAGLANANSEQIKFFNEIRSDPSVRSSLVKELSQAGEIAEQKKLLSEEQANLLKSQIAQLDKATSNYEIQMWSGIINQTINTAANAIGEFTRFGLAKKFLSSPQGSDNSPLPYWPGTTTHGQEW